MSGSIPFTKASACGNDFLIIEGLHAPSDMAAFTRRICDRHAGVGADGVEWLFPDQKVKPMFVRDCSTPMALKQRYPGTEHAA